LQDDQAMKAIILGALILLLGCKERVAKPMDPMQRLEAGNLTDQDLKRVEAAAPGMTKQCIELLRVRGINALPPRTEDCFEMTKPQRWKGIWRNEFEGSNFCPGATTECQYTQANNWLEFPQRLPEHALQGRGGEYAIDFIGRRTLYRGKHGHMGMSDYEFVVDRVISLKEVERPPRPATKAELTKYFKKCEATKTCIPNWDEINKMKD
jgi:hypothetical protein